jgi:hypothetical protein
MRRVATIPKLAWENLTAALRWIINHEWMALGTLLVVSCEFMPRIARELVGHIEIHLGACAAAGTVASSLTDPGGGPGSEDMVSEHPLAVGDSPNMWVRAAWIATALCAHFFLVVACRWVVVPFVRRFVFDDA